MHLNRNLNTVFYAVIAVSYGKEYLKVFTKISLFCYFQHGEKREKRRSGHESDKLIESYSVRVQPTDRATIRVIDYQAIYKHKMSRSRSVQPVLTDAGLIISSTFSFFHFLSFHHPQLLQIYQFLCFIVQL